MDEERFRRLVERTKERGFRAAYRVLQNREDALDVLQEAYLELYRRLDSVAEDSAGAWIARVATNRAFDVLRHRSRAPVPRVAGSNGLSPPDAHELHEERDRVLAALGRLSPRQREVITLRVHEDLSFAEIARLLGLSEGATKTHFRRGLDALRRTLTPSHRDSGTRR